MFDLNQVMNKIQNKPPYSYLGYLPDREYKTGDILINIYTGQIATLTDFVDDPYAIFNPDCVAYVIGQRDDMDSTFSDHWHEHEVMLYKFADMEV
jgi:hypothetical protein